MQKNVQFWFNNAVLTIGAPLGLGEVAGKKKVTIFENEVRQNIISYRVISCHVGTRTVSHILLFTAFVTSSDKTEGYISNI